MTAKEIYGFCKNIEKVNSEDTYYDAVTGRGEPTVYIHAGSYGYQIDILYVNSDIGEFPVLSVKRTRVSSKLRGTEAIQAIINGEEKSFLRHEYSLLPTEELFEFIELVRSYDGTDGELIAENTNSWRLQNFG